MRRLLSLAVLSATIALLMPASALANSCTAAPGVAAIDQYCVLLPGAGGDESPYAVGPNAPSLREVLSPAVVRELEKAGALGQALLAMPVIGRSAAKPNESVLRQVADLVGQEDLAAEPGSRQVPVALKEGLGSVLFSGAFRWALLTSLVGLLGTASVAYRTRVAR